MTLFPRPLPENQDIELPELVVAQQNGCCVSQWCFGMWYVYGEYSVRRHIYMRNDGMLFPRMQETELDLNYGTYFPTQQDAQAALDRYNEKERQV